jgi:hypothetical protein
LLIGSREVGVLEHPLHSHWIRPWWWAHLYGVVQQVEGSVPITTVRLWQGPKMVVGAPFGWLEAPVLPEAVGGLHVMTLGR